MRKLIFGLVCFFLSSSYYCKEIKLVEKGVIGDGVFDNWEIIQKSIDEVINAGGGKLIFPEGEFAIYGKSIVIWGSNVEIEGDKNGRSKIIKKGDVGYFGDCIDICGKITGYHYYGEFGVGNYDVRKVYRGKTYSAKNVILRNINISSDLSNKVRNFSVANNLGIINTENVQIINCKITNAPQTNVAIVNDTEKFKNLNISFIDCEFSFSGQHNVRVISYNKGLEVGNTVLFKNCKFENVKGRDINQKEILGESVNLWHRGLGSANNTILEIRDCFFDESGYIFVNGQYTNFLMMNSIVKNSIVFQMNTAKGQPYIRIQNSFFSKKGDFFNILKNKRRLNIEKQYKNSFRETELGIIYPSNLKYSIN